MILLITEIWKRWKSKNERKDLRDNSQWIPQILIAKPTSPTAESCPECEK